MFVPKIAFLALVFLSISTCAEIVSTKSVRSSPYEYAPYYDDATLCDSVVMINVGTNMRLGDYSKLANAIVTSGTIAIIVDSNPGRLQKDDGTKYADAVNAIAGSISSSIPNCITKPPLYFIGGHSGGGKGAINAMNLNILTFPVAGFVGLDPFGLPEQDRLKLRIDIPSVHWGFSETSCLVTKENAGAAAYSISNPNQRIFYRVNTRKPLTIITGPHCSFTNVGCKPVCRSGWSGRELPWIRTQVGISIHHFIVAVKSNNFDRNQFVLNETGAILFVNQEVPN